MTTETIEAPRVQERRVRLDASEEELLQQEVEDASAATPEERMEAALTLLDTTYRLWLSQGIVDDEGLCRFPGRTQQRRRPLRGAAREEKDLPDLKRLRRLRDQD